MRGSSVFGEDLHKFRATARALCAVNTTVREGVELKLLPHLTHFEAIGRVDVLLQCYIILKGDQKALGIFPPLKNHTHDIKAVFSNGIELSTHFML